MSKALKSLLALMAILAIGLASCATTTPTVTTTTVPTTPTTVAPSAPTNTPTTVAPVKPLEQPITTTTTIALPSVSQLEMNNLLSQADALKADAQKFELDALLPDDYKAVDSSYAAVAAEYQAVIAGGFDGTKAFPIKAKLEASVTDWESFNAKGMPLKADSEFENASNMRAKAMEADASTLAADRYAKAEENLSQANASVGGKDFAAAIPAYKYSAAAYEVAAEKAKANTLREKIFENGYAKYSDSFFKMGEDQYAVEDSSWAKGSLEDLAAGIAALKNANGNYEFVISKGAEYKSFEGKDAALAAQQKALSVKADINASEEYSGASDILTEALANQGNGSYESAYLWFGDASSAFGSAYDSTMNIKAAADDAIGVAEESVQKSDATAVEADLGDNVYIKEAKDRLDQAKAQYGDQLFSDATSNANEALNYSTMSDNFVVSEKARLDKEAADKLSADKAAADPAMTDARNRLAWASANDIGKDYPNQYKDAKTGMAAAELAYANERYAPAKALAGDVSATISDSFQSQVLAERQAIADKAAADKATADKAAADKAAADKAAADAAAQAAAAQAAADKAAAEAAAAQAAAEKAAAEQAAAEQAAAAQLATEKAAADPAMADARDRMAWANSDNIAKEYPKQYRDAKTSLDAAELAYGSSRYVSAKSLAEDSSATLSDDFKAQVASDRKAAADKATADRAAADAAAQAAAAQAAADKAAAEAAAAQAAAEKAAAEQAAAEQAAAAQLATEKAAADPAMADARDRMAWADSDNIAAEYPSQYKDASANLNAAELAYGNSQYVSAKSLAESSSAILSDEFKTQVVSDRKAAAEKAAADKAAAEAAAAAQAAADKAAADAAAAKAAADQIAVEQAAATRAAADKAAAEEAARQAAITQAKSDIDKAQAKLDWAVSKNAKNNYSSLWAQGAGQLDAAKFAFDLKDYKTASAKAQASYVTLSGIAEFAPLPAKYTVRLIPERRDCLWRIAEYGFVYNNPLKWPILYEANKKTFKDPSNPNLIYPGQVLVIPSIKGETREGSWDPNKTYQPLAK